MISLQEAVRIAESYNSPFMPNFKARKIYDSKTYWSLIDTKLNLFTCSYYIHKKTGEVRGGSVPPFDWMDNVTDPDILVYEE